MTNLIRTSPSIEGSRFKPSLKHLSIFAAAGFSVFTTTSGAIWRCDIHGSSGFGAGGSSGGGVVGGADATGSGATEAEGAADEAAAVVAGVTLAVFVAGVAPHATSAGKRKATRRIGTSVLE